MSVCTRVCMYVCVCVSSVDVMIKAAAAVVGGYLKVHPQIQQDT